MRPPLPRREFLRRLSQFGVACTCGCLAVRLAAEEVKPGEPAAKKRLQELQSRAHCGLICNNDCPLFKATKENDTAAKEKVYKEWKWKEQFGVEFNPDQVFCHGCKAPGKPVNIAHARCTVLKCSVERKLESCLECRKLAECAKDLWRNWPDFHRQMIKLQQEYAATDGFKLS